MGGEKKRHSVLERLADIDRERERKRERERVRTVLLRVSCRVLLFTAAGVMLCCVSPLPRPLWITSPSNSILFIVTL